MESKPLGQPADITNRAQPRETALKPGELRLTF
jgi:hypothetical protein